MADFLKIKLLESVHGKYKTYGVEVRYPPLRFMSINNRLQLYRRPNLIAAEDSKQLCSERRCSGFSAKC